MAGMSGIEVLERLKYVNPAIEVVMMTAYETTDTMRQALRLRACDYINKPFDVSTMRAAVATAMQRRTLESEIHTNAEKLQQLLDELQSQKIEEQMATDARRNLRQHHSRYQRAADRHLRLRPTHEPAHRQRHPARSGGPGVHQGPAQDHHPPGHQLHRDLPPLPQLPAPPIRRRRRASASTNCSRTLAIWSACIPACRTTSSPFARWPRTSACA